MKKKYLLSELLDGVVLHPIGISYDGICYDADQLEDDSEILDILEEFTPIDQLEDI